MQQNSQICSLNNSDSRKGSRSRSRQKKKKSGGSIEERSKIGRPSKKNIQRLNENENEQIDQQISDSEFQSLKQYENSLPDDKNKTGYQMMEAVLRLFYQIGEKKGLVFDQDQRKQFKAIKNKNKVQRIKWTEKHQWHLQKQAQKLKNAARIYDIDLQKQQMKRLVDTLLQVSALFAQQFTDQVYKLLLHIWLMSKNQSNLQQSKKQIQSQRGIILKAQNHEDKQKIQENLNKLADRVCYNEKDQYYCLSLQFKVIKDRKKRGDQQITQQIRIQAYRKFVTSIYKSFSKM